jgi:hypothetical protein
MADLIPWTNLLPSYQSPGQMAQQNASIQQTQAQTGLLGAQTQGADIANQSAALTLGAYQNAINGGSAGSPGGAGAPGGQPPPGGTPSGIGQTGVDPNDVTDYAISKFAPIPTARPPSVTQQMYQWNLAGKPEVAASIGAQYDQQVAGANQQRQLGANAAYQTAEQVANAPAGAAFETLNRYDPQAAAAVKAKYPDDSADQLDADVRTYAQHIGIATHQYTGRDTDLQNGVLVDKKDGAPVLGSEQVLTGLDNAGRTSTWKDANELVTVQNTDGSTSQIPRFRQAGYNTAEQYLVAADRAARSSANTGAPAPNTTPSSSAPSATRAAPTTAPKAPAASAASTTQAPLLPGVDLNTLPKSPAPVSGRTPDATQQATNDARKEGLKDAMQQQAEAAQGNSLLTQFQNKLNTVNPRDVGPGSSAYKALQEFKTAVTGKAPDDLVDMGVLDKFANQLGVQNVRSLLSGQKITNQEMMNFLTRASASTTQPLDVMKTIVAYQKANNDYDRMASATKIAALQKGADPFQLPGAIETAAPRSTFVQQSMDKALNTQPTRPGQQTSGAPVTKVINGVTYTQQNGKWYQQ